MKGIDAIGAVLDRKGAEFDGTAAWFLLVGILEMIEVYQQPQRTGGGKPRDWTVEDNHRARVLLGALCAGAGKFPFNALSSNTVNPRMSPLFRSFWDVCSFVLGGMLARHQVPGYSLSNLPAAFQY